MITKVCFKCSEEKPIDQFSKQRSMKDGYSNRCKACAVKATAEWRKNNNPDRHQEYLRALELGTRSRQRARVDIVPMDDEAKHAAQCAAKCKWNHKNYHQKLGRPEPVLSELDELCLGEAFQLVQMRNKATGIKWSVDHIVPYAHKLACGLHNAFNIQVVPLSWNSSKGRGTMDHYWD